MGLDRDEIDAYLATNRAVDPAEEREQMDALLEAHDLLRKAESA